MGVIQHVQVGRVADGTQHGLRAWPEAHTREHAQPRAHLHKVRHRLLACDSDSRMPLAWLPDIRSPDGRKTGTRG